MIACSASLSNRALLWSSAFATRIASRHIAATGNGPSFCINCERVQSRPFGVALLVGGVDEGGYVLYHADPSGTYVRYQAKAIGSGSEGAQSLLQEKYAKDLSLQDALTLAVTVLKQVSCCHMLRKLVPTCSLLAICHIVGRDDCLVAHLSGCIGLILT